MSRREEKEMADRYSRRLEKFGFDPRTLGWENGRQGVRFDVLLSQWDFRGKTVLDVGCGFGDLFAFCEERHLATKYQGIDMNADLIREGRRQHPRAKLEVRNFRRDGLRGRWDYIVCSGIFNAKMKAGLSEIKKAFTILDRHARLGFAANFLSSKVDFRLAHANHSEPARILDLAYAFSNRVLLRNDYMPFEFTVFVDKRKKFDEALAVYPEYGRLARWKPKRNQP